MFKLRETVFATRSKLWHQRPRILELLSTLQADLVRPFLDGEHTTLSAVMAPEGKLENPQQEFHQSCARCRRSQLPLASSHSTRERTLVRAKRDRAISSSVVKIDSFAIGVHRVSAREHNLLDVAVALVLGLGPEDPRIRKVVASGAKSAAPQQRLSWTRVQLVECALQLFKLLPSFAELAFRR